MCVGLSDDLATALFNQPESRARVSDDTKVPFRRKTLSVEPAARDVVADKKNATLAVESRARVVTVL